MPIYRTEPLYVIHYMTLINFLSMDVIYGNLADSSLANNVLANSDIYFN